MNNNVFYVLMIGEVMDRNDWQYFDEDWESEEKESVSESSKKQCCVCLRWIDMDSPYCVWCGRPQPEKK